MQVWLLSTRLAGEGERLSPGKNHLTVAFFSGKSLLTPLEEALRAHLAEAVNNQKKEWAMSINVVERIDGPVKVRNVLVSVSDKRGLESFIPALLDINPGIRFFSTGGTYGRIKEILGDRAGQCLTPVSDYTGQPETQGGLVKTLDFKIYLGLLTETYNEAHQQDLQRTEAVPLDMVVVNLYPFEETTSREGVTVEAARGNIDIGGPCMIRAAAKNFIRVSPVVDPADYLRIVSEMEANQAAVSLELRWQLAGKAFEHTAAYDRHIADFLGRTTFDASRSCYQIKEG
jgi:phosphoribosylaminoimidazolecarboxamide formyltransferase/IMP cyclohydrolase